MSETQWFYEQRAERKGPVTRFQLEELLASQQVSQTTLVWRPGFADWVPVSMTELGLEAAVTPPPLTNSKVSDVLAWLIAASPVLGTLYSVFIDDTHSWVPTVALFVLTCIDVSNLRKAGYSRPAIWWVLLPFAYLFLRSRALSKSQAPLIVWLGLMLILLALPSVISGIS